VTGCFTFRATFFTGAGFGLAFAAVGFVIFAAFDGLRALPRTVTAFLFCAFDPFLRLAMIDPLSPSGAPHRIDAGSASPGNLSNELSTDRVVSAPSPPLHSALTITTSRPLPPLHTQISE
jgi:hypothetical protein